MRCLFLLLIVVCVGCTDNRPNTSDETQHEMQEKMLQEATSQTGMPAVKNFRERKMMKEILELRDQTGLTTYTYIVAEMTGKLIFVGESIGYGLPASTQYTNPQRVEKYVSQGGYTSWSTLPQADPNGLFSPLSAEGTWVLLKNPNGSEVKPVYIEPRIIVSPFRLDTLTAEVK